MKQWTPQDVETETLAGYDPLNAWNRAVVLGGAHYEEWRRKHIEPIRHSAILSRHQLTEPSFTYARKRLQWARSLYGPD